MDLTTKYNRELAALAANSDGTERDAICEWAYNNERYPTLNAYARRGIVSHTATARTAARLAYNERVRRLSAAKVHAHA